MTINQGTKILIFQKRIIKIPHTRAVFDPGGVVVSKTRERKSWSEIRQGEMWHSMPGDNKSLEIKNLSNLLPINWDEFNHVDSLKAGCKLRQTTKGQNHFSMTHILNE